ncbi:MAG: alpha/beta hydrolase [Campylobacterota bacterium]|nr:alpha/beta hydrolase [Campylobacterota bacterium]
MGVLYEGLRVMLTLISAYVVVLVLVFLFQSRLIFFPMHSVDMTPKNIGLDFEDVRLQTKDGIVISAWFIPSQEQKGLLLFCHGNAGNISHRLESIRIFHDLGLSVLIFDYRGYGQSEGVISEEGSYLDAQAAWEYLVEDRHIDPSEIIIFGRSIGGAIATQLATKKEAAALILESSFTSITDLGAQLYPYLPIRFLSRYDYDTSSRLKQIHTPLLIIHSPDDEVIPFTHAKLLYDSANEPKELLEITGDHNAGIFISGEHYIDGIDRFLSLYKLKSPKVI